jgi:tetratricopeptide (TPR) repeat protein
MKRLLLIATGFMFMSVMAQEGPSISSAILEIDRNNDLAEGKKYLDEAKELIESKGAGNIKEKNLSKFYYYEGLLNMRIAATPDEKIRSLNSNALEDAVKYYSSSIEYEAQTGKKRFSDKARFELMNCTAMMFQQAIDKSDSGDRMGAAEDFEKIYLIKKETLKLPTHDSTAFFNAAIMAEQASRDTNLSADKAKAARQKAISINEQLLVMGYKGIAFSIQDVKTGNRVTANSRVEAEAAVSTGDYADIQVAEPVTSDIYLALIRLYKADNNEEKYKETLANARKTFPNDINLINMELQDYLDAKDIEGAMKILDVAIENDPKNKLYHYVKGVVNFNDVKNNEAALESYDKALEIDPKYFDALYMKGLLYIGEANKFTEEMNKLNINQTKKYDALKAEQKKVFAQAKPLFEGALEVNPEDADTLRALKEVYYRLGEYEKSKEMGDRLGTILQ